MNTFNSLSIAQVLVCSSSVDILKQWASICSRFAPVLLLVMSAGGGGPGLITCGEEDPSSATFKATHPQLLRDSRFLSELRRKGWLITSDCFSRQLQFLGGGDFHGAAVEEHNGGRAGMKSVSKLKSEHDGIFQLESENRPQFRKTPFQGQKLS